MLRGLRFVSKLAVLPQGSQIFRIHILLKFEKLFLEAYGFQNSEGLEGSKEYAHSNVVKIMTYNVTYLLYLLDFERDFAAAYSFENYSNTSGLRQSEHHTTLISGSAKKEYSGCPASLAQKNP